MIELPGIGSGYFERAEYTVAQNDLVRRFPIELSFYVANDMGNTRLDCTCTRTF